MRIFEPWVGSRYRTEGLSGVRILVLGESHYGDPGTEYRELTIEVVREWGQQKRLRFFKIAQKLICGLADGQWVSDQQRAEFWERVAFYNFVQSFPGPLPRYRPTADMWLAAVDPFNATVREFAPSVVVVLGFELFERVPRSQLPRVLHLVRCQHPSSAGFRYQPWASSIQDAIGVAAQLPPNPPLEPPASAGY